MGTGAGCVLGLTAFFAFELIGILLCCTGIGAILGFPLMIAGLVMPFLGPVIGLGVDAQEKEKREAAAKARAQEPQE